MQSQGAGGAVTYQGESIARRLIVRDMGNGVDRVELGEFVLLSSAKEESRLPERTSIALTDSPRVRDVVDDAAMLFGCPETTVVNGFLRQVDEVTLELVVWTV